MRKKHQQSCHENPQAATASTNQRLSCARAVATHLLIGAGALICVPVAAMPANAPAPASLDRAVARDPAGQAPSEPRTTQVIQAQDMQAADDYFQSNGVGDGSDGAIASGENAIAAGPASFADGSSSSAFGHGAAALGDDSTAAGAFSLAVGQGASAFGFGTTALGDFSTALGYGSSASGYTAMAFGYNTSSNGDGAIAIGNEAFLSVDSGPEESGAWFVTHADGALSTAIGPGSASTGTASVAIGPGAEASGDLGMAMGYRARAGFKAIAMGTWSVADSESAVAIGSGSQATNVDAVAVGSAAASRGIDGSAFGTGAYANGDQGTALGAHARAWALQTVAVGNTATADGEASVAIGSQAQTWGEGSVALGRQAEAGGFRPQPPIPPCDPEVEDCGIIIWGQSTDVPVLESPAFAMALGERAQAFGTGSVALGYNTLTLADNSVALGAGSMADRPDTVSVGSSVDWYRKDGSIVAAFTRQITNVSAGTQDTDAVNVAQLGQFAGALGGDAQLSNGMLSAPGYSIQGITYDNVGAAFGAVDDRLSQLSAAVGEIGSAPPQEGPPGPEGPQGPEGPPGPPGTSVPDGVAYDSADQNTLTLGGESGTQIRNVANGTAPGDAVNKGQMDTGDATTLSTANSYTDVTATKTLAASKSYTDQRMQLLSDQFTDFTRDVESRLNRQDKRMDKMGAMSSAMMNMSINAAGSRSVRGRVAVGAGWQNGESALSIGYARNITDRTSMSIGGAFTSDDQSAGVGFGIDL